MNFPGMDLMAVTYFSSSLNNPIDTHIRMRRLIRDFARLLSYNYVMDLENDYLVPEDIIVNDTNKGDILNTPRINAKEYVYEKLASWFTGVSDVEADWDNYLAELETIGFVNLGVKARPDLVVLQRTKMPAILLEVGFINSDADNELFTTQFEETARAIAEGIADSFEDEI